MQPGTRLIQFGILFIIPSLVISCISLFRAELQVRTTKDYSSFSFICTILTGALNHQVAHHLFPGMIQSHYRKITPIIQETCNEFGIPYHTEKSFLAAFISHLKFLFHMGHQKNK